MSDDAGGPEGGDDGESYELMDVINDALDGDSHHSGPTGSVIQTIQNALRRVPVEDDILNAILG